MVGCGVRQPFQRGETLPLQAGALQMGTDTETPSNPETPETPDLCIPVEGSTLKVCEIEFTRVILPALQNSCAECHEEDFKDFAAATATDYFTAGNPEQSPLYLKPTGKKKHKGGAIWNPDSEQAKNLADWITGR